MKCYVSQNLIRFLILILLIFNSCTDSTPVRIGFISDLSSRNSQLGIDGRNGVSLALAKIGEESGIQGRDFELLIRDHQGDRTLCERRTRELIDEGVDVIIGPMASGMAASVINATKDSGTLIIAPTVSTDELIGLDDNFLRVEAPSLHQGEYLAEAVLFSGNKRICLIYDEKNSSYVEGVISGFKSRIVSSDVDILEILPFGDKAEFPDLVETIGRSKPDSLLFMASGIDTAGIIQQYAKSHPLPSLYGSSWVKATGVLEYGGKALEGMMLVDSYMNKIPLIAEVEFVEHFSAKYGVEPTHPSIHAYEAMLLYAEALEISDSTNPLKIKEAIIRMDEIQGIKGVYRIDEFGDALRPLSYYLIEDGEIKLIELSGVVR
ncbi:MAG: ABC transporter substrate-binding protein [Spirochaetales bacterium]|nr:ABC transporter substrate-binding protein [Spirochaetales bacterium]